MTIPALGGGSRRTRYRPLLISLLLLSAVVPVFEGVWFGAAAIDLVSLAVLISGVWVAGGNRRDLAILAVLGAMAEAPRAIALPLSDLAVVTVSGIFTFAFLAYVTALILGDLMATEQVSADTIGGAICGYLMIGITWGALYFIIQSMDGRSFNLAMPRARSFAVFQVEFLRLVYYSLVTLTTVGYGDISARIPLTQNLSALEAMVGQFYIAVLVARLVSLQILGRGGRG